MSNLKMVVSELQEQNRSLSDVREDIKGLLQSQIDADKEARRSAGDDEEERRESKKQQRLSLSERSKPKTFAGGLAKGTGVDGLLGGIKGMLGPMMGAFTGALSAMSIGALLGAGIGYLFRVGVGALLGKEYLQPLIDKMLPDFIQDFKLFGDGEDAMTVSELSSMVAGAAALIFGPKLIGRLISKGFGSLGRLIFPTLLTAKDADFYGKDEKENVKKKVKGRSRMLGRGLIRNLGIAGIIGFVGAEMGSAITGLTGSEALGNMLTNTAEFAAMGMMMFGPAGAITLALGYLAVTSVSALADWLKTKGDKMQQAMIDEVDKSLAETDRLLEAGDLSAAAAEAKKVATHLLHLENLRKGDIRRAGDDEEMNAYLARRQKASESFTRVGIITGNAGLVERGRGIAEDIAGDENVSDRAAVMKIIETRAKSQGISLADAAQAVVAGEGGSGLMSNDFVNMAATIFNELVSAGKGFQGEGETLDAPSVSPKYVTKIKVPGGTYTPGIQWEKIKSVPGFGVADMFGSGNIFTNGPPQQQSSSPAVNIGDYSTKISNFASKNTFMSQHSPVSTDEIEKFLGKTE